MCCEHLICARCGGPVAEARCGTCAQSRARMHTATGFTLSPQLLAALIAVLAALAIVLSHAHL